MKTIEERAEELYKYSPNDNIEIPSYLKGRQEERAIQQEVIKEVSRVSFFSGQAKERVEWEEKISKLKESWYKEGEIFGKNKERAEWEEKTRWKELRRDKDGFITLEQESELCKHFPILTKGMYGLQIIEILGGDLEKPHVCTHWKEII